MSSPTSQIIVHHIMCATRVCRPPHPNGILSSTIQTGWALFSIKTTSPAIHTHLISQFACQQSTFHSVKGHNRTIKSRSGDGSRHLGMWWTIVLHISWSTLLVRSANIFNNEIYLPGNIIPANRPGQDCFLKEEAACVLQFLIVKLETNIITSKPLI